MARFGLIGNPISHSKSPALFAAAYDGDHSYELIEASALEDSLEKFLNGDFKGINVTSPYKDRIMEYVSCPDRVSSLLGSANVVIKGNMREDGTYELFSYNTDYFGVKNTIQEFVSGKNLHNAMVVGAGGAGKAAALAMKDLGYNVFLVNRSAGKIAEYAAQIGVEYVPLDKIAQCAEQSDIIVYALSFMVDALKDVNLSEKIVLEANYANPVLASQCSVECGSYLDGRLWLYHQAVPAFELFVGKTPDLAAMRKIIGIE
jgi:shikimate dehydrogenase